jgi:hypothetical protein
LSIARWRQVLTRAFDVPAFLRPASTDIAAPMFAEWPLGIRG